MKAIRIILFLLISLLSIRVLDVCATTVQAPSTGQTTDTNINYTDDNSSQDDDSKSSDSNRKSGPKPENPKDNSEEGGSSGGGSAQSVVDSVKDKWNKIMNDLFSSDDSESGSSHQNSSSQWEDAGHGSRSSSEWEDAGHGTPTNNNSSSNSTCKYLLGSPSKAGSPAYYLDITFKFIKFLAPILLIVVSIFDYIKAIVSSDGDIIEKTNKKTIKRLAFALVLFVLPIIISYLLTLLGVQGTCGFDSMPGI